MRAYQEWKAGHIQSLDGSPLKPDNVNQLISQVKSLAAWTTAMAIKHPEKNKLIDARKGFDVVLNALNSVEQGDFSPYTPMSAET